MMKSPLACGLILTLAACASNSSAPGTAAAPANSTGTVVTAPAPATAQAPAAQPAKPKLVCEEDKPLGSLIPQRICMTPEEAAARRKAAQDRMRNLQNQSAVGPGMGSSSGG